MKILAICGSTRKESYNKMLLNAATHVAQELNFSLQDFDFKTHPIPFYDGDLEQEGSPENATLLRKAMIESDVIFLASPEHNRSVTAVLKNAMDWASRSEEGTPSRQSFEGKHFVLLGTSPGRGGAGQSLAQLQVIVEGLRGIMLLPAISIPSAIEAFGERGLLKNKDCLQPLQAALGKYLEG